MRDEYRSGEGDIVEEFLRPALRCADEYCRAVGYFSSSAFEALGTSLSEFVRSSGTMRLVTSVELYEEDHKAIEQGAELATLCEKKIAKIIDDQFRGQISNGVDALIALVAAGRLEVKIAIPATGKGIFHEKLGIILSENDFIVFSGSMNESKSAFYSNYECVDVFRSWDSDDRANRKRECFEKLWAGTDSGATVLSFPEAALKKLIKLRASPDDDDDPPSDPTEDDSGPDWSHQIVAEEKFLAAKRGVLEMATGTGKTRTALNIVSSLFGSKSISSVIVSTAGNDLMDQWARELRAKRAEFGFPLIYRAYGEYKEAAEYLLTPGKSILICSRQGLAGVMARLTAERMRETFLILDEVHGLGSPAVRAALSTVNCECSYVLGLSATPEREYDQEGTRFIEEYVGPVIYRFGLEDAIKKGILTAFNYVPLTYELTQRDRERLANVYKRAAARKHSGNPMSQEELWTELARVYKTAEEKVPRFKEFIASAPDVLQRCIVFVETMEYGEQVANSIHAVRPDFHTYFSGESSDVLKRFATEELECLITCHRLSEGIDIRSLTTVILFSSARAKLETIQRIGRCLRVDPANPDKVATIIDFVRNESESSDDRESSDSARAEWLRNLSTVRRDTVGAPGHD